MAVAAIYDIHANLPALEAVLEDIRRAKADRIVVGGDVLPGPMPRETMQCLLALELPLQFIHGNGDREVLAAIVLLCGIGLTLFGLVALTEKLMQRWYGGEMPVGGVI